MKAFEKWWKEEGFYFEYEAMCEETWKAALEWIKSRSIKRLISVNEIEMELKGENREMD